MVPLQKRKQRFDVWNDIISELNHEKQNAERNGISEKRKYWKK